MRYFKRAKRIRLRIFEKMLAALRMPHTGEFLFRITGIRARADCCFALSFTQNILTVEF
ncbi:hypothetical protein HMPREF9554_00459 [Treponema phagedenis F0421]|nr:hypothetical protein HMPREF9554_00459 [Treponema phagedenis F0421]